MNTILLITLSLMGLFAIYWALIGQWNYNKMMQNVSEIKPHDKTKGLETISPTKNSMISEHVKNHSIKNSTAKKQSSSEGVVLNEK